MTNLRFKSHVKHSICFIQDNISTPPQVCDTTLKDRKEKIYKFYERCAIFNEKFLSYSVYKNDDQLQGMLEYFTEHENAK